MKEIQVAVPGQDYSSHKNSATHSCQCEQDFRGSKQRYMAANIWDFLCAHKMLMHVTAHGGCADSITKSHWKQTLGEKSLASLGNGTCIGIVPGFSAQQQCSTKWVPPVLPPPPLPPSEPQGFSRGMLTNNKQSHCGRGQGGFPVHATHPCNTHLLGVFDVVFPRQQLATLVLHDGPQQFLSLLLILPQLPRALTGLQSLSLFLTLGAHQVQDFAILWRKINT